MSIVVATSVLVRRLDGALLAECRRCALCLQALSTTEDDAALASFGQAHPTGDARHGPRVPAGWREPLSWPGALSQ